MFNMYQELVDRINELLEQRKEQEKLIEKLKTLYLKIPLPMINELTMRHILSEKERNYWIQLKLSRKRGERNEQ